MAGGNFDVQNKTRAGVYIRFRSKNTPIKAGTRGTVAVAVSQKWGADGYVVPLTADSDIKAITGYPLEHAENLFLRELFKGTNRSNGANKVLLYRLPATSSAKAVAEVGNLTATAKYKGTRGNDLSVRVTLNTSGTYMVDTLLSGELVDRQEVSAIADLVSNGWVDFSGTGALAANTGVALTGGANGTVSASAYTDYLGIIEGYKFDAIVYDGSNATISAAYVNFVKRIAEEDGAYTQLVAANLTNPDSRLVINVASGVTLDDGTALTAEQVCFWVAGATAGAGYNQGLTAAVYPGAVGVTPVLTNAEIISALEAGEFILTADNGAVRVESDINSLVTYTQEIGKVYHKNRIVRTCNQIAKDIYDNFTANFLGVIDNNEEGRGRLKTAVVGYLLGVQANSGIQNFTPDNVSVTAGEDADAVVIDLELQSVDSTDKFYITVSVA